jgi:phosphoribosyl-AMP cyclohydrolase
MDRAFSAALNFNKQGGLVPAVVQDWQTSEVLMVAYMNPEALTKTLQTGKMHYYSRSRGKQWMKGETSGHMQDVVEVRVDCEDNALLFKVRQHGGAACHTGYRSCFHRRLGKDGQLEVTEQTKVFDPATVYGS